MPVVISRSHRAAPLAAAAALVVACSDAAGPSERRFVVTPEAWFRAGLNPTQYEIGIDSGNKHSGGAAAYMRSIRPAQNAAGVFMQQFRAADYRGRRVRWSAWLRPTGIAGVGAGLWMRIDGPGLTLGFDNMINGDRAILGTSDWRQVSVVLDVPSNAIGIAAGVLLAGTGEILVDDVGVEFVGTDVPVTDLNKGVPTASSLDSLEAESVYSRSPFAPSNLDFEGLASIGPARSNWLNANAVSFNAPFVGTDLTDLASLRQWIGDAHVVGLGEGTHGTREFFQMKHRTLELLVRNKGFTLFGIEATWPEANDVNQYVLNGVGDPALLLSRLYFWTWNTQEVLDLILWMREWNKTAPVDKRVQFVGFDMQSPGAAMDTVTSLMARVAPDSAAFVATRYACLGPYRNHGATFGRPRTEYSALSPTVKSECRAGLTAVHDFIRDRRDAFEPLTSAAAYANALQSARLVVQWEAMSSANSPTLRDQFMAENALWLLDQAGPGTRMVLWAHNLHMIRGASSMGGILDRAKGDDYVNLGFLFGRGTLSAVSTTGVLMTHSATLVWPGSLEEAFFKTDAPRLMVDMRRVRDDAATAALFRGPILMREIGSGFDPRSEDRVYTNHFFPSDFDLLVYFRATSASTLLSSP